MAPRTKRGALRLKRSDAAYLARGSEPEPLQISRTQGSTVIDSRGRRYIDFVAGWCAGNLGWGHPELTAAIKEFDGPDYVMPSALYAPWAELAGMLAELSPGKLKKSYRATGGSEAVEIALQLAQVYTSRAGFISLEDAYHGNTLGTVSVGEADYRAQFSNRLTRCKSLKPPLDDEALERVEKLLRNEDVAAVIMEPISLNLTVLIPEAGFMKGLQRLCRKYGTLLIMDEVATGFGRTGKLFATEHYDLEPDILCLAKAITGGYLPMGATLTTEKIANAVGEDVEFYSTFGWHPRSVAVALANLRYWKRHQRTLLKNVEDRSADFATRLAAMSFGSTPSVRIKGLAVGVEFEDEGYGEELAEKCREKGLLLSGGDDYITMFPPLTISRAEVTQGLDILERCL